MGKKNKVEVTVFQSAYTSTLSTALTSILFYLILPSFLLSSPIQYLICFITSKLHQVYNQDLPTLITLVDTGVTKESLATK